MKLTIFVDMPHWDPGDAIQLAGRLSVYIDEALKGTTANWKLVQVENDE